MTVQIGVSKCKHKSLWYFTIIHKLMIDLRKPFKDNITINTAHAPNWEDKNDL